MPLEREVFYLKMLSITSVGEIWMNDYGALLEW
jgi:hypothetical protein